MPENHTANERLDSWKDIASYLGRDVRTVIRWEEKGLPVHRVPGGKRQAVFAYRTEIDHWLLGKDDNETIAVADVTEAAGSASALPAGNGASHAGSDREAKLLGYAGLAAIGIVLLLSAGFAATGLLLPEDQIQITKISRLSRDALVKMGLATDGTSLYFSEYADGKIQLSRMPVEGGPIDHITTPFAQAALQDASTGAGELLVLGRDGKEYESSLWIVPVNGLPPRKVGNVTCHSATRSPDGKVIAYSRGNSIFLTLDEGATSRDLAHFESDPQNLHWAAPGSSLRIALQNSSTMDLIPWEITLGDRLDVVAVSRMPSTPANCCQGSVETTGYQFVTTGTRNDSRIWALPHHHPWWRAASTQKIELPTPIDAVTALASDVRANRLYVIGGEPVRGEFLRFEPFSRSFTPFLSGVSGLYPDFSRDGKWIVYKALDDGSLWISRVDGRDKKQLTSSLYELELPRWSPDGATIAFTAKKAGPPWRIYVISRDGGPPREASSGNDNQGAPTWSPDGKWIAYANVACQETHTCAVHRIELATGKVDTLPGSAGLRTARWSPDGHYIAALQPEQHQLLVFDVAKQRWKKLTDSIMGDDLSWSQDSQYLYSNRPIAAKPGIFRIPVSGGKPENVVDLELLSKLTGKFDTGLCLAPDNSVILLRQINSSDIYALDWSRR